MSSSFATSTFPGTTQVSPFTTLPPVSPSTWAKSATEAESLLASPTSLPTTSPYYYSTDSDGHTTTFAVLPGTATGSPTGSSSSKTTTIILGVILPVVVIGGLIVLALLVLRRRTRRRRQAWRARYPSQWSWDAKYHDAEPDPTPLDATSLGHARQDSGYEFAPSHSRFPSSDLPKTPQRQPSVPPTSHYRDRSM
ncbi:hypothetical protein DACRYDRAFT_114888 [Dacryopinax primogenitus]|uniref:Mid2 domain-containing protein n=1 Tax=Dacryopinax primogenitus (strain DJM 731) TaxID=1858805 RepID=M5GBQ6_DACPD|nr:uncharacterized protein DACRYDRAFT_114888 [Dacryopinax primogenitus]EJU03497.1 hypothetical protein DACRYDRAFT_114888 [Dacryopinax primogenitus]